MNPFDIEHLSEIYDGFASAYDHGRAQFDNRAQLNRLADLIPSTADVLDVGCGSGIPVLSFFAARGCRVTGTDISHEMLTLAAQHVPDAQLIVANSANLDLKVESFDLITSFYSLFHLEMDKQTAAFAQFFKLLKPGGTAYFTLASERYTGMAEFCETKEFAGVNLPYSHITPAAYRSLFEQIGFVVESMEHLAIGGETMLWCRLIKSDDA